MWPAAIRVAGTGMLAMLLLAAAPSPWIAGDHSAVRLIAGASSGATRNAGVEIRLDPSWHTYWKAPGTSGVPPVFDWSGAQNIAGIAVSYPVPQRFEDADGVTFGYQDDVVFPVRVRARDPRRPVTLAGTVRYAVCARICIPAEAKVRLVVAPDAEPDAFAAATLEGFAGRVPKPAAVGERGPMAVTAVHLDKAAGHLALVADVAAPDSGAVLFAAGEGAGVPQRLAAGRWRVPLEHASGRIELVLADADAAISVPVALDEVPAGP